MTQEKALEFIEKERSKQKMKRYELCRGACSPQYYYLIRQNGFKGQIAYSVMEQMMSNLGYRLTIIPSDLDSTL